MNTSETECSEAESAKTFENHRKLSEAYDWISPARSIMCGGAVNRQPGYRARKLAEENIRAAECLFFHDLSFCQDVCHFFFSIYFCQDFLEQFDCSWDKFCLRIVPL